MGSMTVIMDRRQHHDMRILWKACVRIWSCQAGRIDRARYCTTRYGHSVPATTLRCCAVRDGILCAARDSVTRAVNTASHSPRSMTCELHRMRCARDSPEPPITLIVTGSPDSALVMTLCIREPLPVCSLVLVSATGSYFSASSSPGPSAGQKENGAGLPSVMLR